MIDRCMCNSMIEIRSAAHFQTANGVTMFDTYQLPRVILRNKIFNGRNSITTEEVRLDGQVYAKEVPRPDRKIYPHSNGTKRLKISQNNTSIYLISLCYRYISSPEKKRQLINSRYRI